MTNEASASAEKESDRIFWVIQTVFGFIIGRSFYEFGTAFLPSFSGDKITLMLAFASVYACVLWSWIDYSFTTITAPYRFRHSSAEKWRFVSDLAIVLIYTYLLIYLQYIRDFPDHPISSFLTAFVLLYVAYTLSGALRILEHGRHKSRIWLIVFFWFIFLSVRLVYGGLLGSKYFEDNVDLNRVVIAVTFFATIGYRLSRSMLGKRKYRIAIDVDGVLADQITNLLPAIERDHGVKLQYADITDWKLPIGSTSIDALIVEEQKHGPAVLRSPLHPDAKDVVQSLIRKHYIAIATARAPASDSWTREWLKNNGIPYDTYHNLKEGQKHNSHEAFDVLVDDYIGNLASYLKISKGKAILFSQPWNNERKELEPYVAEGRLEIVKAWKQIPGALAKLLRE